MPAGFPFASSSRLPSSSPPHTPTVSSPLSSTNAQSTSPTSTIRPHHFPTSKPLRPFPLPPPGRRNAGSSMQKSSPREVTIEPPSGFQNTFVLNLTQAEFSRQD